MKFATQLALPALALSSAVPKSVRDGCKIDEDDFVHVKGLRLFDAKGLHYITGP
jgi:mannan endo-1,4-beta-mannosidase